MSKVSKLVFFVAACCIISVSSSAIYAQRDAGAKARGEFGTGFWTNQSAGRHMGYSRGYAQGLCDYSANVQAVSPQVAQPTSDMLGQTLSAAKKDIQTVRKELGADKEVKARLDEIEKHLNAALAHHKSLHMECCKESGDVVAAMTCCSDLIKEVEKAQAEHSALLRKLYPGKTAQLGS